MGDNSFLTSLISRLSPSSEVLIDEKSPYFTASMERWSDYGVKTPFAIVQPTHEQDIMHTVQEAVKASIPFVPKSGGHSPWSTIGQDGIIIDLSHYKGVVQDTEEKLVTVKSGTLIKELQAALHPHKQSTGTTI